MRNVTMAFYLLNLTSWTNYLYLFLVPDRSRQWHANTHECRCTWSAGSRSTKPVAQVCCFEDAFLSGGQLAAVLLHLFFHITADTLPVYNVTLISCTVGTLHFSELFFWGTSWGHTLLSLPSPAGLACFRQTVHFCLLPSVNPAAGNASASLLPSHGLKLEPLQAEQRLRGRVWNEPSSCHGGWRKTATAKGQSVEEWKRRGQTQTHEKSPSKTFSCAICHLAFKHIRFQQPAVCTSIWRLPGRV